MEFNSLDELISYVEKQQSKVMEDVSLDMKNIIDNVVEDNVQGWTGQIFDSVINDATQNTATAEFIDNGEWYSEITGKEVGNPIKFLEAGTTWNKDKTDIIKDSQLKVEMEIPDNYKRYMKNKGIPIV